MVLFNIFYFYRVQADFCFGFLFFLGVATYLPIQKHVISFSSSPIDQSYILYTFFYLVALKLLGKIDEIRIQWYYND